MIERVATDAVVVIHLLFILFAVAGGLLVLRWRWLLPLHLLAVAWAIWIELSGGICPLTPLEQTLRLAAGEAGFTGGFIEHYLQALIYPAGLTREIQYILAGIVTAVNIAIYGWLWFVIGKQRQGSAPNKQ